MGNPTRPRPPLLRALGRDDPPLTIEIEGRTYQQVDVFKHDSWAATARYRSQHPGDEVVCKFNRTQPVMCLPMTWLGRWLARRELLALTRLAGVRGIPAACGAVFAGGRRLSNAVAHEYVDGRPLRQDDRPDDAFFPSLQTLLQVVHQHGMAYVDLHKRENILVDTSGRPWLIDFQVCFALWSNLAQRNRLLQAILRTLQETDWYHLAKHIKGLRPDQMAQLAIPGGDHRPRWIRAHRAVAVPLRTLRRNFLAAIGVRSKGGKAVTEVFPEAAVRLEREAVHRLALASTGKPATPNNSTSLRTRL